MEFLSARYKFSMAMDFWARIERIRQQPEHVRARYVFGCLAVSMVFIFGIWLLSVKENFQSVASDMPRVMENGKALLPDSRQAPSLNDLFQRSEPLRVDSGSEKTGQQFFQEQFQKSSADQGVGTSTDENNTTDSKSMLLNENTSRGPQDASAYDTTGQNQSASGTGGTATVTGSQGVSQNTESQSDTVTSKQTATSPEKPR